jgi:site-specific DNA recombinase
MQKSTCYECIAAHRDWVLYRKISEKGVSGFKVSAEKRDAIQAL